MNSIIKILYLECVAGDTFAAEDILVKAGIRCEILAVNDKPGYIAALKSFSPQLIISDDSSYKLNAIEALSILNKRGLNIPLIVVALPHPENMVVNIVNIMKQGAYDYILKENIHTLPAAVANAIKKHRAEQITNPDLSCYISTIDEVFFSRDMLTLELLQISPGCEHVYGYSTSEFMEDPGLYGRIYHPEDKDIFPGFIARLQNGERVVVRYRIIHKDGGIRWIESTIIPTLDQNGILLRIDGVSRDITERKKTEEQVEKSNIRIREAAEIQSAILNAMPPSIALLNKEGTILSVNESWKRFADSNGLAMPDYGIGTNYVAISEEATNEDEACGKEIANGIIKVISGSQKAFTMEYPCDSPTEKRWFQAIVAPLANQELNGAVVVHFNITERKLAEEKLQQSEEMYRLIVETAQEGVWIIDENLETKFINKKMCEILGYTAEEVIGKHNYDFKEEGEKANTIHRLKTRNPGTIEAHESAFITKSGKLVYCRVTTNAIYDAGGRYLGLVAMITDITQQKADDEALKKSEANLSAIIENTTDLVYSLDPDYKFITFNQLFKTTMKQVYGFDIEQGVDAIGLLTSLDPEVGEKWRSVYTRAINGKAQQFEIEYPFGDEKVYLSYSVNPIWETGKIIGLSCFSRDITRQKQDEAAIRQSAANLTAIIENTPDLVYSLDTDYKFITYNQLFKTTMKHAYGFEIEQCIDAVALLGSLDPEVAEKWKGVYTRAINGEAQQFVIDYPLGDDKGYFSYSVNPIWDTGKIIGLSCFSRDITRQKQDEAFIKQSAANLTAIIENSDANIYSLDKDLRYIAFNASFKNSVLHGFKTEIKPGDKILDIYRKSDPESAKEWENIYTRAFTGERISFTKQFNLQNETTYYNFSINPIWENDVVIGLSCAAHNITKQKLDEIAIQKSEASLRTIFNNTDLIYLLIDSKGKIVSFNEPAKKFSLDQNRVIEEGYPVLDWVHGEQRAIVNDILTKVKDGAAVNYQSNREINGVLRWLDLTWAGIKDGEQHDFGCILTIRDITNTKKLEMEREKITNDLIQRNKALEQFTYVVSHNLRAPLANIIGLSSLVRCQENEKSEFCEIIDSIDRSAIKLDEVIKDLNRVLQVNEDFNENIESIILSRLIESIKFSIRNLIEKEHVSIICEFADADQMISLKSFIHSIFYNLILNSIKYRNPGIDPVIKISSNVNNGKLRICYEDNGRGIDTSKYANEIFGLYKRFDTSVEGRGMGLFMVKTQVESLGGNISVQSVVNKGTKFVLEFPQNHLQYA